jgi:DNA-binding XRE family transcriptional regulator
MVSKPKKKAAQRGRPTKYLPAYCDQARKLCLLGATDKDLANFFDVNEDTIHQWKKDYPKFSESIKEGKSVADANIADRLYQRAMGFEHDSEEIKVIPTGKGSKIQRVPIRKIYPPDTVAAIFWLKNRQKEKWRDKIEQDITSGGEKITALSALPPDDLKALLGIKKKLG